jgi:histidine ammonia-lyase
MATFAANRLHSMLDNSAHIVAIELLAGAQGIEFHHPQKSSPVLEDVIAEIRRVSDRYETDRSLSEDVSRLARLVDEGFFYNYAESLLPSARQ